MSAAALCYVGLGSNLLDPAGQIVRGIDALALLPGSTLLRASGMYLSAPLGPPDQPDYVNAVACLETTLQPLALLDALQALEQAQGRRRLRRWGPRTLDLDLLLYADRQIRHARLTVPHPQLQHRAFVLHPLSEIAPDLQIPGLGALADLLAECPPAGTRRLSATAVDAPSGLL